MKNSLTNILKNKKSLVNFAAGIALSLSLANYGFAQNRSINFEKENFENIKKKAEKENKLIFMDCYTTWCGPCKAMDKNVFTNDSVADFYNKNFLNVKINMESEEGKKIGKSFHIDFYPTFLYINEKEKLIHKGVGGFSTRMFVNLGEEALNPETQLATFNEKYEKGNRDGKFIYEYLKKLGSADIDYKNISEDYFKTQKEEDLTSRINWDILFIDPENVNIDSKAFNYLIKNKNKFDEIYTADSVDNKLFNAYYDDLNNILNEKSFNDSIYQEWKNKIKKQNFSKTEEVLLLTDLKYNEKMKNWEAYASSAVLLSALPDDLLQRYLQLEASNGYPSEIRLNNLAWSFFNHVKDKNLLEKALNWAENSLKIADKTYNNNTYACLLYVLGDTTKAMQIEEKAIKLAKESSSEKVAERYSNTLKKMKAGEKLY